MFLLFLILVQVLEIAFPQQPEVTERNSVHAEKLKFLCDTKH